MELKNFFEENNKCALAFSGGVDSSYLLYAAKECGADATAYYVKSPFQPQFEFEDAKGLAKELNMPMVVIEADPLDNPVVAANPKDRCYYCKQMIFGTILQRAQEDGYTVILDGTNASDDAGDRPGMKALAELKVLSPLRICGLTKDEIRRLSKEAGLFTWNKPAYACLATRIPSGEEITAQKLSKVEASEEFLFSLGFKDFRVRTPGGNALVQLKKADAQLLLSHKEQITEELRKYFNCISFDTETRG